MIKNKPMVIGHRGAAGEAPENTLSSFQLAVSQGAEGIELDVHVSKNGDVVVCHDPTLDRTTDGSGYIFEMETEHIKQADAGSWFSESFRGEKIPLLTEVLDIVPEDIMINVEIKHSYHGHMEERLLDLLRERRRLDQVVISSFDHKCLKRLKQQESSARIGLLYAANLLDHTGYAEQLGVDVYSLHPYFQLIGKTDVEEARFAGKRVYPYTVNLLSEYHTMLEYGVSGIITDYPGRLVQFLKENGQNFRD